jgi:hypothetical protein
METNIEKGTTWSDEDIKDLVLKLRNDLIKDFLDESHLKEYLATNFNMRELTGIKIEFIKKALKELLITSLDEVHYQSIVDDIKNTNSAALTEGNEKLFYKELELIFKRYMY